MKYLSLIFLVLTCTKVSAHKSSIHAVSYNGKPHAGIAPATLTIDYTYLTFSEDITPQLYVQFAVINNTDKQLSYLFNEDMLSKFLAVDNQEMQLSSNNKGTGQGSFVTKVIAPHGSINLGVTFKLLREPNSLFKFKLGMKLIHYEVKQDGYYENELRSAQLTWSAVKTVKLFEGWIVFQRSMAQKKSRDLQEPLPIYHALTTEEKIAYALSIDTIQLSVPVDTTLYYFRDKRKVKYLLCYVSLQNNSRDTLKYINMNCSYTDVFLVDNKDVSVAPVTTCYKNGPEVISIPPNGSKKIGIPLVINRFGPKGRRFKIGMTLQKYVTRKQLWLFNPEVYLLRPETANMIWSNEVQIP